MITFRDLGNAGRLGNQLFQIAATIGIAEAYGESYCFPRWSYEPFFHVNASFVDSPSGIESWQTEFVQHIDDRAKVYLQDVNLFGWTYDFIGFNANALGIFKESVDEEFFSISNKVAVHVRRGDNAFDPGVPDKHLYHPMPADNYYRTAFEICGDGFTPVVFSDDIPWCRDNMPRILDRDDIYFFDVGRASPKENEPTYGKEEPTDWLDMLGMSLCSKHVISNSTFSWWGAYLANSLEVCYPDPWFGPKLDYIDTSLMFPQEWRKVNYV